MALVTASSEPFAMAATIAGGEVLPAVISEANILTNLVRHAYEVFRGMREMVRGWNWRCEARYENSRTPLSRHDETLGEGLNRSAGE